MQIIRSFFQYFFGNVSLSKKIIHSNNSITYPFSQHLIFFGKKTINYEPVIWAHINQYIKSDSLIFDIGANIGQYGIRFSSLATDGTIISVEPDPGNLPYLYFNKFSNQCLNIEILNVGIASKKGRMLFYRDLFKGGRVSSFLPDTDLKEIEVDTITFDNLVTRYGIPDFVKIDVEGFEEEVVKSIAHCDLKTTFLVEVRASTKEFIFNYFISKGYNCYSVDQKDVVKIDSSSQISDFENLLFHSLVSS